MRGDLGRRLAPADGAHAAGAGERLPIELIGLAAVHVHDRQPPRVRDDHHVRVGEETQEDLSRRLRNHDLDEARLITSEDHRGLAIAIGTHLRGVAWLRCKVHVVRDALGTVGRTYQRAIAEGASGAVRERRYVWYSVLGAVRVRCSREWPARDPNPDRPDQSQRRQQPLRGHRRPPHHRAKPAGP